MNRSSRTARAPTVHRGATRSPRTTARSTTANTTDAAQAARKKSIQVSTGVRGVEHDRGEQRRDHAVPRVVCHAPERALAPVHDVERPAQERDQHRAQELRRARRTRRRRRRAPRPRRSPTIRSGRRRSWFRQQATSAPSTTTGHTDGRVAPVATTTPAVDDRDGEDRPRVPAARGAISTPSGRCSSRSRSGWATSRSSTARSSTPGDPSPRPLSIPSRSPAAPSAAPSPLRQSSSTSPMLGAHPRRSGTGMSVRDRPTSIGPT